MVEGPLIEKYLKVLEENPRSRVFAPLAESYRRLGMIDRSIEILKDGMRYHPNYVVGYLGLAACYSDLGQYQLCYATLKPFVPTSRDNLRLQRLFAEACEQIGHDYEALETYKFLLFLNPKDSEAAKKVAELESKNESFADVVESSKGELFPVEDLNSTEELENVSWVEVNFHKNASEEKPQEADQDSWKMVSGPNPQQMEESSQESEVHEVDALVEEGESEAEREYILNPSTSTEEAQLGGSAEDQSLETEPKRDTEQEAVPLITHTLVDLYCNQGHFERAEEILLKMLALNPSDAPTLEKLQTVRLLLREAGLGEVGAEVQEEELPSAEQVEVAKEEADEQDGRERLMEVFDTRVAKRGDSEGKVRGLNNFLKRIKARANERQDSSTRT